MIDDTKAAFEAELDRVRDILRTYY